MFFITEKRGRDLLKRNKRKQGAKGKTGRCNIRVRHSVMSACFFLIYGLFSAISPRAYKRQSRQRRDAILSKLLSSLYSTR